MQNLYYLQNTAMNYDWGSPSLIPELMGESNPENKPIAEIWIGAHDKAPSLADAGGSTIKLNELISQSPEELAGKQGRLPFLMKLLAAEKPLSVQAHPAAEFAKVGFEKENTADVALDAPERNYRDPYEKRELLLALTPFTALCGFRKPGEIHRLLSMTAPVSFAPELELLKKRDIKSLVKRMLSMNKSEAKLLIREFTASASSRIGTTHEAYPMCFDLLEHHPTDTAALMPMLLNIVRLQPGESLYVHPRQLHLYIEGMGVEVMTASDNVVRAGLTSKHVDVNELLNIGDFISVDTEPLQPRVEGCCKVYAPENAGGSLRLLDVTPSGPETFTVDHEGSPLLMLCVKGAGTVSFAGGDSFAIKTGQSAFVPAAAPQFTLAGNGRIFVFTGES